MGGVVIAGVLLAAIMIALSSPNKKNVSQTAVITGSPVNTNTSTNNHNQNISGAPVNTGINIQGKKSNIKAKFYSSKETLKAAGEEKDNNKIERAILNIRYTNNTDKDLSDIKIELKITGPGGYTLVPFPDTKIDKTTSKTSNKKIFTGPSVKKGATEVARTYFSAKKPGKFTITATVRSLGEVVNMKPLTITAK